MSKIATILGILVVGTLGLASCGGSEPEESRVLAPTTTIPPTTTAEIVPVVELLEAPPTLISAGWNHTCALYQGGTIGCWGFNSSGQINNDHFSVKAPFKIQNISDAISVSAGGGHTCALHQDQTISCWGWNVYGQLGSEKGDSDYNPTPTKVPNISNAIAVSAGNHYTCALHQDQTISCWGWNVYGQLGSEKGDSDYNPTPTKVPNISNSIAVSVGGRHACALHQGGTMSCWGWNRYGQIGIGHTASSFVAPPKTLNISNAVAITSGSRHTCALHQDGTMSCWGWAPAHNLGTGKISTYSPIPAKIQNISDAITVSIGGMHTCALHQDQTISCWGANGNGQLGTGYPFHEIPVPTKTLNISDITAISAGNYHTCALHQDSTISCWGANWDGELGNGTSELNSNGSSTKTLNISDAIAVSAGERHTCALHQDGTISCWGRNEYGQLGNGKVEKDYVSDAEATEVIPVKVLNISDAVAISTGRAHTCALHQDSTISCWGRGYRGRLGDGEIYFEGTRVVDGELVKDNNPDAPSGSSIPVKVLNISDATAISAGKWHTCALHDDGTISCWGDGGFGPLGDGKPYQTLVYNHEIGGDVISNPDAPSGSSIPVKVLNISDATAISVGDQHTCALHQDGAVSCWGINWGDGYTDASQEHSLVPLQITDISDAVIVAVDYKHICALHQDGTISCWGRNDAGQLGNGLLGDYISSPTKVLGSGFATPS